MTALIIDFPAAAPVKPAGLPRLCFYHPKRKVVPSERRSRKEQWRRAEYRMLFYRRLADLVGIAESAFMAGANPARDYLDKTDHYRLDVVELYRREVGGLLLLPAPNVEALNAKRRHRKSRLFRFLPVSAAAVDRQIAEDEIWLRANARNCRATLQTSML